MINGRLEKEGRTFPMKLEVASSDGSMMLLRELGGNVSKYIEIADVGIYSSNFLVACIVSSFWHGRINNNKRLVETVA